MRLMIRSKLGKRLAAFLCAMLILFYSVAFPVQKAKAVSLPVVAGSALVGVTLGYAITAYLNASGVYPFSTSGGDFASWVNTNLNNLIVEYNLTSPATLINSALKFFAIGSTVLYPRLAWNALADFTAWLVRKHSMTNNQDSVVIEPVDFQPLPVRSDTYYPKTAGELRISSTFMGYFRASNSYAYKYYYCVSAQDAVYYPAYAVSEGLFLLFNASYALNSTVFQRAFQIYEDDSGEYTTPYLAYTNLSGYTYKTSGGRIVNYARFAPNTVQGGYFSGNIPVFSTLAEAAENYAAFIQGDYSPSDEAAFQYDTGTITELPTTTDEYVGLTVSGLDPAVTLEQLQTAIADSVVERLKTEVKPVTVTVEQGTTVDSETGEITGDITIAAPEAETIPSVEALAAPKEFLETMVEAVQTKFPFCLVFDVFNIIKAFDTGPVAPKIVLNFTDPFSKGQYNITVDLAPWDDVAAVVRQLEQMVLFLGFWLNFDKFNVLNIILGQLG